MHDEWIGMDFLYRRTTVLAEWSSHSISPMEARASMEANIIVARRC